MITDELLVDNGYKEYTDSFNHNRKFFQKRYRNGLGRTKYFINFYKCLIHDGYEVHLQFEKDKYTMNILLFAIDEKMTIKEIEQEVHTIWYELHCKYYDYEEEE